MDTYLDECIEEMNRAAMKAELANPYVDDEHGYDICLASRELYAVIVDAVDTYIGVWDDTRARCFRSAFARALQAMPLSSKYRGNVAARFRDLQEYVTEALERFRLDRKGKRHMRAFKTRA